MQYLLDLYLHACVLINLSSIYRARKLSDQSISLMGKGMFSILCIYVISKLQMREIVKYIPESRIPSSNLKLQDAVDQLLHAVYIIMFVCYHHARIPGAFGIVYKRLY